jgi:hypothetical protein
MNRQTVGNVSISPGKPTDRGGFAFACHPWVPPTAQKLKMTRSDTMHHNHSALRRRGIAMVMALIVMSLLVTTIALLAVAGSLQAKRTRMAMEDAQLRQLLVAGIAASQARLNAAPGAEISVALPESLRQQGAALTVRIEAGTSASERTVEIDASLPRHRMSQRAEFSMRGGSWQLVSAELGS